MITLGAIPLSDHLTLTGLETSAPVATQQRRTLTGRSVVAAAGNDGGRTLALSGDNHFTLAQIEAVRALAVQAAPVALVHHRGSFSVLITAIEAEPAFDHANPAVDDWYSATIPMIEV